MDFDKQISGWSSLSRKMSLRLSCSALVLTSVLSPAYGQFTTVINLPPDSIASQTIIGSDTQVNFFADGSMGSNINFGHWNGTDSNVEFNMFGGSVSNFNLNTGSTGNIAGGSIFDISVEDLATLNMTAGDVREISVGDGNSTINISGGTVTDLNYRYIFQQGTGTLNISGGVVSSNNGIGFNTSNPTEFAHVEQFNLTGGTVNSPNWPNFTRNASLTGGTFNGNLVAYDGVGVLDGATINGSVSSGGTGTLSILSGSSSGVGAGDASTTNVLADVGITGLSFNDGGTINLNHGNLNVSELFINNTVFGPATTATLNMNTGTVVIDRLEIWNSGRDNIMAFNINGSDVTLPSFITGYGMNFFVNLTSGSLSAASSGASSMWIPIQKLTISGGTVGDDIRVIGLDDSYGVVTLSGGTIGDGFVLANSRFEYLQRVYLSGSTIGDRAGFSFDVEMAGGSVGNDATFGGLYLSAGTVGNNASTGFLHMTGGSIGDNLDMQSGERSIVEDGNIGNSAIFAGLTLSGGTIGSGFTVYDDRDDPYRTPSLLMTGGSIGPNAVIDTDAQIDGGQVGVAAEFKEGLRFNGGSIGDDALFRGYSSSNFDPPVHITGGTIGDRATFNPITQIDGGSIGEQATFWNAVRFNGGTLGDNADFINAPLEMTGGKLGDDAQVRRDTTITGGEIGERFTMPNGGELYLHGTEFYLDGVDIGSTLSLNDELLISDREVWLTGVLDNGTPFDLFLSDDANNQGVTDYFRFNSYITIRLTDGPTLGDLNGDGALDSSDISPFVMALTDPAGYEAAYPGLYANNLGDFTGDGVLNNADIAGFVDAIGAGGSGVPEPNTLAVLLGATVVLGARRRRAA